VVSRGNLIWQVATLTLSVVVLILTLRGVSFQLDFDGDLYRAGARILQGLSPYRPQALSRQAAVISAGGSLHGAPSPRWPMPILLLGTPLSLLPVGVANLVFMLVCIASVLAGLRLLGVRDSRCFLVALISPPTVIGIMLGNLSPLLLLGAAVVWRLRGRVVSLPLATALVVVSKVLFWPLGLWMLMRRRIGSLLLAALAAVIAVAVAWATIGFRDLLDYPQMLVNVMRIGEGRGDSLTGFLMYCGLPVSPARAAALAIGAALLAMAAGLIRRPGGQANAFGLVIVATLTVTPVVWSHYLVLLFVPIALLSPRLSPIWSLPALAAFAPTVSAYTYGLWVLPTLMAQAMLVVLLGAPLLREATMPAAARQWGRAMVAMARAAAPS
jgi:alpha-1,2-mannosyltransferase